MTNLTLLRIHPLDKKTVAANPEDNFWNIPQKNGKSMKRKNYGIFAEDKYLAQHKDHRKYQDLLENQQLIYYINIAIVLYAWNKHCGSAGTQKQILQ